ncbi:type 4a pilus biogenesis protein PilO [Synoicihabitans lomoniglobus]|uniref:Type 4a pilus biogenesis protein PilO n=1 Tax=Synoicihabitans lomoniglobus TaxID=2909285 RepID=A0AAF0CML5_9BACT|nr:type 4a pilus biogenesis protein PilO [Opitutaceae bacterium LMO-M01]WED64308.1 type 4a pilus biogenesis protein PilO [Opitutaceae bacterium LMO-M01]
MFENSINFVRRHTFITGCFVVTFVSLGVAAWMMQTAADYDTELERVTDTGTAILRLVSTRSLLESELEFVKLAVNRTEDNLVVEDNLAENLWYFYSIEGRTKTRLADLRQIDSPRPNEDDLFRRIPYELRVTGTFVQVSEFLRQLEVGPRLMRIKDFTFRREPGSGETISLELMIELLGRK